MQANEQPVLSVQDLTVRLGDRNVIHDLSFEVARGENLAIIGPNGAGKTVLLRALLNVLPSKGEIRWARTPGWATSRKASPRIASCHSMSAIFSGPRLAC